MNTTIFLDLEDTVIEPITTSWSRLVAKNVIQVKNWINDLNPSEINIFSFAIHDDREVMNFSRSGARAFVEDFLSIRINRIIAVEQMIDAFVVGKRLTPGTVDFTDFVYMVGKQHAFPTFIRQTATESDHQFVLLDDTVFNETIELVPAIIKIKNVGDLCQQT